MAHQKLTKICKKLGRYYLIPGKFKGSFTVNCCSGNFVWFDAKMLYQQQGSPSHQHLTVKEPIQTATNSKLLQIIIGLQIFQDEPNPKTFSNHPGPFLPDGYHNFRQKVAQGGIRRLSSTLQLAKLLVDDALIKVITSVRSSMGEASDNGFLNILELVVGSETNWHFRPPTTICKRMPSAPGERRS